MDIVAPVVGGVIGYFTNWLAIKMLFRPYTEKKIFNIKVPFTPGLMPKERYVLSKKVGDIVSKHLLTQQVIGDALVSDDIHHNIENLIDKIIVNLNKEDKTIDQVLNSLFENDANQVVDEFIRRMTDIILSEINNEAFQTKIADFIVSKGELLLQKQASELPFNQLNTWISDTFRQYGKDYISSGEFEQLICANIMSWSNTIHQNQSTMGEILSRNTLDTIRLFVTQKVEPCSKLILEWIEKPEIEVKIKEFILYLINENVSKVITLFASPTKIYESIINAFKNYLNDENNYVKSADVIINYIDQLSNMKVNELNEKLNYNSSDLADTVIKAIRKFLTDENLSKLLKSIGEHTYKLEKTNLYDIIKGFEPELSNKASAYLIKQIKKITQNEGCRLNINKAIKAKSIDILNLSVKDIANTISLDSTVMLKKSVLKVYDAIIKNAMIDILEAMNIARIVENRINDLGVEETEKIVLEVVKKELSAITIIGGVLGFIIGLIPELMKL
jgi:uncharacterized membrane protein YheB (UPF0754 family)